MSDIEVAYRHARTAEVPAGRIAYVREGRGKPLLLLHGIPMSLLTWRHNVAHLARAATVVAPDMLGFGRSAKPAGADYSVDAQARTMVELLDHLGLEAAGVVGNSYGCAVALAMARLAPERVGSLVLINAMCYPGGRHSAAKLSRIGLLATLARTGLRAGPIGRRMVGSRLRQSYASFTLATPELIDAYYGLLLRDRGERSYLAALRALDEDHVASLIPGVTQRTLVIWGARDRLLPVANGRRLADELPSAQLEVLGSVGHLPQEEAPDRINRLITDFTTSSPSRRKGRPHVDVRVDGLG